jgi:hypothetical protein
MGICWCSNTPGDPVDAFIKGMTEAKQEDKENQNGA